MPPLPLSDLCSGLPDYKNCLIKYAQQSTVALPVYETVHEGFRCTVYLDGEAYRSVNTFGNPEDAEQDASKLALESIAKKIKQESISIINKDTYGTTVTIPGCNSGASTRKRSGPTGKRKQILNPSPPTLSDTVGCKSILNEYAVKMNLSKPVYTTTQLERVPFFISSLVFYGKTYTGPPASNKKDAERLAARKAIYSTGIYKACA
ncbi:hypothetical protein C5167_001696 [Papaver somniferum]|uniref:DRBM domain-containing protein n=1 Tax=Papaver somniferum TaxID=3469 RepID=A0A4Y7KXG3_PAPSO|nr:hypothetical protein C5167_001696 [Papaver somniferum]